MCLEDVGTERLIIGLRGTIGGHILLTIPVLLCQGAPGDVRIVGPNNAHGGAGEEGKWELRANRAKLRRFLAVSSGRVAVPVHI